jgi:hypothetical protein
MFAEYQKAGQHRFGLQGPKVAGPTAAADTPKQEAKII